MLIQTNQLTTEQLKELKLLIEESAAYDGNHIPIYEHILIKNRQYVPTILYYIDNKLVAFLGCYYFYQDKCEVSLCVHPLYRKRKFALRLLSAILNQITYPKLIFGSVSKECWLKKSYAKLLQGEFTMVKRSDPVDYTSGLEIVQASIEDIGQIVDIDLNCFKHNCKRSELIYRQKELLLDQNYIIFCAKFNNEIIGKAQIQWLEKGSKLSDLAILPSYQRRGFGRELTSFATNYILKKQNGPIYLEVQSTNYNAINLYLKLGYVVENTCYYWEIDHLKLLELVS